MTTYTLEAELAGDSGLDQEAGITSFTFFMNGNYIGTRGSSPHRTASNLTGRLAVTIDVTGYFDPNANNVLTGSYSGTGSIAPANSVAAGAPYGYSGAGTMTVIDYCSGSRLRIVGSDGSVYYGEYPQGIAYGPSLYESGAFTFGDGDFPAQQWNAQTGQLERPRDSFGTPIDTIFVYFTIPSGSLFHFQFRADTASDSADDDVTVNVKWTAGSTVTDLGNYTSYKASATGDSPWRDVSIDVEEIYDPSKTNKAEIARVSGSGVTNVVESFDGWVWPMDMGSPPYPPFGSMNGSTGPNFIVRNSSGTDAHIDVLITKRSLATGVETTDYQFGSYPWLQIRNYPLDNGYNALLPLHMSDVGGGEELAEFKVVNHSDPTQVFVRWRYGGIQSRDNAHIRNVWLNVGSVDNVYPTAPNTVAVYADNAGTLYAYTNQLANPGVTKLEIGPMSYFQYQSGDVGGGHAIFTRSVAGSWTGTAITYLYLRLEDSTYVGNGSWAPSTVQPYTAPKSVDYGEYPKGFPYIHDVEDGVLGNDDTTTFNYIGANYSTYVVPVGVTSITVDAYGAEGGDEWAFPGDIFGGKGGYIKSTIAVTPGETLRIYVGQHPGSSGDAWNGGGGGYARTGGGTSGGGATDIRRAPYGLNDRLVVAAGGGGAGSGYSPGQSGGHGGALVGAAGRDSYGGGGGGGTQTAGGAAGTGSGFGPAGFPGSFGQGGDGGGDTFYGQGTGGGGGGWYGGGGGGAQGSGGGGGSNHTTGTLEANVQGSRTGHGLLVLHPAYRIILNDGATVYTEQYFAELGTDVDPSPYNYASTFGTATPGQALNGFQGWVTDPAGFYFDGANGMALEVQSHGEGTQFNALGQQVALRSDGLHSAPKHHVVIDMSYYGSRGSNGEGVIWGYRDANNYWFAQPSVGICQVSAGVVTTVAPLSTDYWVRITVDHNFLTGALTVDTYEFFLGNTTHYAGTHPWSVANGKVGFFGKHQSGGSFWTAALITNFQLIYSLGSIGYNRQYSMQTNSVVTQNPATWYFKATKIAKWVIGAVGW